MAYLTTLYNFSGSYGAPYGTRPGSGVIMDAAGNLFGTTATGGTGDYGVVYEIAKDGSGYAAAPTLLATFNYANGSLPSGELVMDAAGNLFGTTSSGGTGSGTVFEIAKSGAFYAYTPTTLTNLTYSSGRDSSAALIMDSAGNLFGTASRGGSTSFNDGTVFEITKTGAGFASTATVLVTFNGTNGERPFGSLVMDAEGNLFGTTQGGGANGYGTVFEIAKTANGYASNPIILASFNMGNGASPGGKLILDAAGNLFGTTGGGGANGVGTVFEIVKTATGYASTPTTVVTFNGINGSYPGGGLVLDAAGNLFGVTFGGGANNLGTVFEIAKTATGYASTPTTVVTFNGINGAKPAGDLILDAAGNLFGTTLEGGTSNAGTVFEVTPTVPLVASVAGTAQEGQTLTASANGSVTSYQWQVLLAGTWTSIGGATNADYLVQSYDAGRQLRVQVTDNTGLTAISRATNSVLDAAGNQPVYEAADQTTIGSGLFQYVHGRATNTTVNSGGQQDIYADGTVAYTTLNAGSIQFDWGAAYNTTINGGHQYVAGSATGTTVNSGGVQDVQNGGSATDTTVNSAGQQNVYEGATASGAVISSGKQFVYGAVDATKVGSSGIQYVYGSATDSFIDQGGQQNIYTTGTATGTTLYGGVQIDWGTAVNTTINAGRQYVWGTATGTTIVSTGVQHVGAGGIANDTTIGSRGVEHVHAGGAAHNVTFSGTNATLMLAESDAFSGTISGWQDGDHIGLGDILFSEGSTTLAYSANAGNTGGTLTVSDGVHVASLELLGQYTAADFALSSDGHGGTLISDPGVAAQQNVLAPALAA